MFSCCLPKTFIRPKYVKLRFSLVEMGAGDEPSFVFVFSLNIKIEW